VSLYDVLGVEPDATDEELRRAYRRLARTYHPDRHAGEADDVRVWAEARMREITHAWHELGDPERRRRYDLSSHQRRGGATVAPESAHVWQPFDLGDDVVDDRLDDSRRRPPRGGRAVAMVPPVVLASGVVLVVLGFALTSRLLVALGAMGVLVGIALFVLASLSVVLESRQNDLR
jgi:hypothetical protein